MKPEDQLPRAVRVLEGGKKGNPLGQANHLKNLCSSFYLGFPDCRPGILHGLPPTSGRLSREVKGVGIKDGPCSTWEAIVKAFMQSGMGSGFHLLPCSGPTLSSLIQIRRGPPGAQWSKWDSHSSDPNRSTLSARHQQTVWICLASWKQGPYLRCPYNHCLAPSRGLVNNTEWMNGQADFLSLRSPALWQVDSADSKPLSVGCPESFQFVSWNQLSNRAVAWLNF